MRVREKIKRVRLPMEDKRVKREVSRGVVSVVVPRVRCHQIVTFEY